MRLLSQKMNFKSCEGAFYCPGIENLLKSTAVEILSTKKRTMKQESSLALRESWWERTWLSQTLRRTTVKKSKPNLALTELIRNELLVKLCKLLASC